MNFKKIFALITMVFLTSIYITGCSNQQVKTFEPNNAKSYLIHGHNYTYAIYNGEHQLLTHPMEDLLTEMKWRKTSGSKPITDIYLVSHGWNFTLPVSIANYHNYIELIDTFMNTRSKEDRFQPYFIFVSWTSTTRPTTDLAKAVLPFGIDAAVEPFTTLMTMPR